MLRISSLAAVVAVAAFAMGCGKSVLDTTKGEKRIAEMVRARTGKTATVTCPHDVPIERGRTTVCRLRGRDGSRATMRMVQTDDKGNVRLRGSLLAAAGVERRIAGDAATKLGFAVTIDCPDLVDLPDATVQIRCVARDAGERTARVDVTIDARGGVTYKIPSAG